MMRIYAIILTLVLLPAFGVTARGAEVKTVSGEATWYDDGTMSRKECMRRALENARIDALSKNFGTIISQDIIQSDKIKNGRETSDFLSLSSTEVKGEWISDIGEPEYEFARDAEENLIVTCRIKGTARAITNEEVAFEALVLRNGEREGNADTRFHDGDEMKLLFNSASDGYVNVYLQDESGRVYSLLPYPRDSKSEVHVKKDRRYLFFKGNDNEFGPSEELLMTASDNKEYNRLYVLFSPAPFSRPVMELDASGIPSMKTDDFSKWLIKTRRNDSRMGVRAINIEIEPKN
ncbi:MAG: DUF4384 domain-containing protein [Bacteroides sp.]|nr:DUF4384 domain-containing protein [Bacteroides sp.]